MLPISEIAVGDLFANPLWVDSYPPGVIFRVEKTVPNEKMIQVQAYNGDNGKTIMKPFWKKNTDRMFSESWRYC